MKIISFRVFDGRNIYSHKKCIRMDVDLQGYAEIPSKVIEGFNEKLLEAVPELLDHGCCYNEVNGFKRRLEEGTYLAHICEHIIIALQNRLSIDVKYGKAREIKDDIYYIIFQYEYKNTAYEIAKIAVEFINSLISNKEYYLNNRMQEVMSILNREITGPSTESILKAASKRGIPHIKIGDESLYQLGYGKSAKFIEATLTSNSKVISVDVACDKLLTKEILYNQNIPVPRGGKVSNSLDLLLKAEKIGYPVVLKPRYGNQGSGVVVNIKDEKNLLKEYNELKNLYKSIIIEKFVEGNDFRVLLINSKVCAVSKRVPPFIMGDGKKNVVQLIEELNKDKMRGLGHAKPLTKIDISPEIIRHINNLGYTLGSVLPEGIKLTLRGNANLSTGGMSIDYTESICQENIEILERASNAIGLDVCGIDVCCKDISMPFSGDDVIIEVNAAPGIRMHEFPYIGKKQNVGEKILDSLLGKDYKGIPLVSITGTNGKTTVTRAISYGLSLKGYKVGMTTTGGIYIGNTCIEKGDTTGPDSAKTVLMNKTIDAAVLETARGGIVRRGLAYDLADVAVITNITEDHLEIDGINSMEDLAKVKALVGEAVKENGSVILNADDKYSKTIIERMRSPIIFFSKDKNNEYLSHSLKNGGTVVYSNDGALFVKEGNKKEEKIIDTKDIKMTMNGILQYNIENAMAAAASLYALHEDISLIKTCLLNFDISEECNPGRFNLFNVDGRKVILDYGHNIGGYKAVLNGASKIDHNNFIGIIGVPGDRTDKSIMELGRISSSYFDYIYVKEDLDKRGRKNGEVAELLKKGILSQRFLEKNINVILDERDALISAIENSKPGDLIIIFFEHYEPLLNIVKNEYEELNLAKDN